MNYSSTFHILVLLIIFTSTLHHTMSLNQPPNLRALTSLYSVLDHIDFLRLNDPSLGYSTAASTSPANIESNRYSDILAYDHALLPGPYLNAAYIPTFHPTGLSFVVSQAPLPDTYTAFYTHIVEQRVRVLVNLTPLEENNRRKADQYWPETGAEMVLKNGWKVRNGGEREIELADGEARLVRRMIQIETPNKEAEGWAVTQFHLTSWPDHGTFPTKLMLQLMHEIQQVAMPKMYPPPPTWIHCSAGVGRSGTLAAVLIAQATINNARAEAGTEVAASARSELWDLPLRIVEHLRRYRPRMVQTIEQFEAVYEITGQLAKDSGLIGK